MSLTKKIFGTKLSFEKMPLIESKLALPNPCRGWYHPYTLIAGEGFNYDDWHWDTREDEQLALLMIDLCNYKQADLDNIALRHISKAFSFFKEHKKELLVRFTYNSKGGGLITEPNNNAQIETHIFQLSEILHEYSSIIFCIQGLFVGTWGEMHSSRFVTEPALKILWKAMRQAAPDSAFFAVRKPSQLRWLFDDTNRLGLFNDGMLGSKTDLGTYPEDGLLADLDFVSRLCATVPNGGEAVSGVKYGFGLASASEAIEHFKKIKISYLNSAYDEALLDSWKSANIFEENAYSYIGNHLGYRFLVTEINIKGRNIFNPKSVPQLEIKLANVGFANIYEECKLQVKIADQIQPIDFDLRKINPDETATIVISLKDFNSYMPGAEVSIGITRIKDQRPIFLANEEAKEGFLLGRLV